MGAVSLEGIFESQDLDRFMDAINRRAAKLGSQGQRELLGIANAVAFRDVQDHFRQEEGPDGAWTAWSAAYGAHMERIGKGGNKLLQDTGRMRQAFAPAQNQPPGGLLFVNTVPYSAVHDEGSEKKGIPQREFMWLSEEAMEQLGEAFLNWTTDGE